MGAVLRWIGLGLGGLVVLLVAVAIVIFALTEFRLTKTYAITPRPVAVPTDQASLVRGQHLVVAVAKCADCHGANLGGDLFLDAGPVGRLYGPNLTRGRGGLGGRYSDTDWVRALRHGVTPSGRATLIMPAEEFYHFSDADLGAIIAYIKSLPPVDNETPASQVGPLGRLLFLLGQLPLLPAEIINHDGPRPVAPAPGPTAAYGAYLADTGGCKGCHGPGLSGGPIPGVPPDFPAATNLTRGGPLAPWSEADFTRSLRTGRRPDGSEIDRFMPWIAAGQMTDDEIRAVWLYLQEVPPRATGNR